MTLTRKALIEAVIRSRKLDRLIGRLASWTLHPPADPTESGDLEARARRELQALADLFQRSAEEKENKTVKGTEIIAAERARQVEAEGWTAEHDDTYTNGELAKAAFAYLVRFEHGKDRTNTPPKTWPWASGWWRPSTPIRNLAKAGALVAAEIDRRLRAGEESGTVASDRDEPTKPLSLGEFSHINRRRCESELGFGHKLSDWSLSDWMTATTGELGEAANIAKKINRHRDGIRGNTQKLEDLQTALADELADTFIYIDLLAQSQGIDLGRAVISKFNRKSEDMGCPIRIPTEDEDDG